MILFGISVRLVLNVVHTSQYFFFSSAATRFNSTNMIFFKTQMNIYHKERLTSMAKHLKRLKDL